MRNLLHNTLFPLFFLAAIVTSFVSSAQIIQTFAGDGVVGFSGEGAPAIHARFNGPFAVTSDQDGNIYLADAYNNVIQKIDTFGILSRYAGSGLRGYTGDGAAATSAKLSLKPYLAMAVDSVGNLYFCDSNVVRRVDVSGIITTVVGSGAAGSSGDGGPATAATLQTPSAITFDRLGNLYIRVFGLVRKVNTAGIISTYAGSGTTLANGIPATSANLFSGYGIAADFLGNVYVSVSIPYSYGRIVRINSMGIINIIAGGGTAKRCYGCSATSLRFHSSVGLVAHSDGTLYVTDPNLSQIHKITPDGLAYHIAGIGDFGGYSGDGGPASFARINMPYSPHLHKNGNLLFADKGNYRFRKISFVNTHTSTQLTPHLLLQIFPNPVTQHQFSVKLSGTIVEDAQLIITDLSGKIVLTDKIRVNQTKTINLNLPTGPYTVTVHTPTSSATTILLSR